jgi:uncharacterized damage-inducible protein DinB
MNIYGAKELAASFRTVRKNTIIIAGEIDEQHYGFRATPETRTVAQMLIHLAMSTTFPYQIHAVEHLASFEGFDFMAFFGNLMAEEQTARSKHHIVAMLQENGDEFAKWLEGLSDEFLAERVKMMPGMTPPDKTRFEMLLGVKEHEMHHRAQLMLVERMVGMVPHLTREANARMAAMQSAAKA